jgi:hypothetical protein
MVPAGCRDPERQPATPPAPSQRALPQALRAAVHNLRGGRRLGSVVMLTRAPGSSWAA